MNLKELRDTFTEDIDEDIGDTEFTGKATRLINRAYKELAKREELQKVISLTAVNNEVLKPADFLKVVEIRYDGEPITYKLEGDKIIVPADGEVNLLYQYIPESLVNDGDIPLTNAANDEFIISYAKYLYLMIEEEVDRAQLYKRECDTFSLFKPLRITKAINVYGMW